MQIPLLNLEGQRIKTLKSYVLECHGCYEVTRKLDLQFCPRCGKPTLLKVTCELNDQGELILFRKKDYKVFQRGKRYPIPQPKEGRKVTELILHEDDYQKPKIKSYLKRMQGKLKQQQSFAESIFDGKIGIEDISKSSKRYKILKVGYGNKNPNTNAFQKKKNKKK